MGAVDLVLQIESPKSVARGLQRIGRAGHGVDEVSRGRIFPKFRGDLLECAVVARRMHEGLIEPTVVPRNALDVLAQQIVAIAVLGRSRDGIAGRRAARAVTALRSLLLGAVAGAAGERARHARRALPVERLRRAARAHRVGSRRRHDPRAQGLAPAGGRQRRHDPRPRAVRGDAARRPPRGRARRGDGLRGAPRPGVPARRVDLAHRGNRPRPRDRHARARRARRGALLEGRLGRAPEGARRGDRRVLALGGRAGARDAAARLRPRRARGAQPARLPARAAGGDARAAERAHDRARALPRRDRRLAPVRAVAVRRARALGVGPGDLRAHPRAHGPGGRRDHLRRRHRAAPARPRRRRGRGAALGGRADHARARGGRGGDHRRARRLGAVRRALSRERLARAADPARVPGQTHAAVAAAPEGAEPARGRAPLRRLPDRAGDLPRVPARRARRARPGGRCCARCTRARSRSWRSRRRRPRRLPPRCCSTTSRRTCTRATRRAPSAARPRCRSTATCCASCSARRSCASCSTPTRWRASRTTCSTARRSRARPAATACTTCCATSATSTPQEIAARVFEGVDAGAAAGRAASANAARSACASAASSATWPPTRPGCTATRCRRAPPGGLPEAFLADVPDALRVLVARYARTHGPFTTEELRERYGVDASAVLRELERDGELVRGELRPGGSGREWCDVEVLRRLRRASLAALRKEIEPADQRAPRGVPAVVAGRRPPPAGRRGHRPPARSARAAAGPRAAGGDLGARRAAAAHGRLLAVVAGHAVRERRARVGRRRPARALRARGAVLPRGRAADRAAAEQRAPRRRRRAKSTDTPEHELLRARLAHGPVLLQRPDRRARRCRAEALREALWDLVWAGEATNDAWAPLRAPRLALARGVAAARSVEHPSGASARGAPARSRRCRVAGR